ncbi:MAG: eukaryotic-like serine/threonine-protein kinase [Candidatus Eremiobacteraeota bacterium]|jgi:serine/threonine-protein kinase|nr:eukaryotic-like serine/threonine-protein kinase [Candidatus Eremiobacteraeota bacterium]
MGTEGLLGGRYRLDRIAGHGGMATVFVALDTVLEREVAIKLLQRRRDEGGVLHERFRREALAAAKIVHPNVVTVHDVGENDEGRPYIVMDFVDGPSLAEVIERDGALPSERVALIGIGLARALAAAHGAGIVHRDVKPQNVLLDEQGIPHLTDFGLARAFDRSDLELTAPGALLGSAHYVAPEQARSGEASPRSDLYALGASLYHAAAGEPPFAGQGAIDITLRRFEEDPPDLRARPGIDPQLAGLLMSLLARDPEERPADAATVVERLADVAAWLRVERNVGDVASAVADDARAPGEAAAPAVTTIASAAPAGGTAADAPTIPPPNSSPLPPASWGPAEDQTLR